MRVIPRKKVFTRQYLREIEPTMTEREFVLAFLDALQDERVPEPEKSARLVIDLCAQKQAQKKTTKRKAA